MSTMPMMWSRRRSFARTGEHRCGSEDRCKERHRDSLEVRESVIRSLFLQSNGKALIALARKEKNPALKREIISKLSLIRSDEVSEYLLEVLKD